MDRSEAVQKLVAVFRQHGYEGTTLSKISEATGIRRASLYHHFPRGKQEMAEAVLEYLAEWFENTIFAPLRSKEKPAERICLMSEFLSQFYDCGRSACLLAIFTLGEPESLFQEQVHRMLKAWIDSLALVVANTGIPSQQSRQRLKIL